MHVSIAGAGIIGLSIAWRLARAGCRVTVRDAGRVASQASWAGAGMLAPGGEYHTDSPWTRLAVQSLAQYEGFVADLAAASGVPIDFRVSGALELAFSDGERRLLARPRPEGVPVEEVTAASVRYFAPVPAVGVLGARWFPNEAVVDPRNVCAALLAACQALGVEIREEDPLVRCDGPTVVAAGAWSSQIAGLEAAPRAYPVKGHLLGYRCPPESLPPIVRHGHHYALQRNNGFTIFGSDEQPGVWDATAEPDRIAALADAAAKLLPRLLDRPPDQVWAGLRPQSEAQSPVVERLPGADTWLAYGHFRNGILLAPITADLVAASILHDTGLRLTEAPATPEKG
ncbi:MAG TPA: FAD-dependent oxidoreductase [Bryobacteraceae bacterium]|nr:FAD-dependent oxidoreductase [Bryobacteraceae bacterium]